MADRLNRQQLESLMTRRQAGCVSIFMPTHHPGPDLRQDPIQFKNLLADAAEQLVAAGLRSVEAQRRLAPARAVLDDGDFWRRATGGLAVFADADDCRLFRVPTPPDALVMVSERFHLKPLLPLLGEGTRFYLLALSQRSVRLFRADRRHIEAVSLPDAPQSFADIARFDDPESQLQFHTETSPSGPGARRPATFHGQGVGTDASQEKKHLLEYCRAVDRGLCKALAEERAPLILAAADPLLGLYRQTHEYPGLHDAVLRGNPDTLGPETLHVRALAVLAPVFEQGRRRDADLNRQAACTDNASSDVEPVVRAAHDGRVATLFVSLDDQQWGRFDSDSRTAELHDQRQPGDQDLLDLAAVRACLTGAVVHAVTRSEVPADAPLAALFRYA